MESLDRRTLLTAAAGSALGFSTFVAADGAAVEKSWETMSLEERNLAFNNVAHVGPDFARQKTAEWEAASRKLRAQHPEHLDLSYGPGDRTKWDLYPAADPQAPCYVHLHGGYWQRGSKEIFACLAEGILARGWSAALPGYTLAPTATLTQIVKELRLALDWFSDKAGGHGISGPVILSGWSAGGHLTALLLDHPSVTAGLAISGVFELGPLRDSPHVNDKVRLTEAEIDALSPRRLPVVNKPLSIAYGTRELSAMIAASRDFHKFRAAAHAWGDLIPVVEKNHFTILDELRRPGSHLTGSIVALAEPELRRGD
jgi:acetyl esterase/lipase